MLEDRSNDENANIEKSNAFVPMVEPLVALEVEGV